MKLLILCAGAGEKDWDGEPRDRPLRTKGKRHAQRIGAWLGQAGLKPDLTLVSPDARALASAQKALKAGGWTADTIRTSEELASGRLPEIGEQARGLLVLPAALVQGLLRHLGFDQGAQPASGVLFHVHRCDGISRLIARVDPRELPALFPFPAPDGPELRDRPAYYYSQSAVIPFRRGAEGTEILMVGSSSGRHWVVPKGIVEPGLSPQASAVVEAMEEAGAEGTVGEVPLGSFSYEKWGAACQVVVYALEVTRMLSDDAWEESHRHRRWVSQKDAGYLLQQPAFQELSQKI